MTTMTFNSVLPWVDRKRYLWLLSPMVPILGMIAVGLYVSTGYGIFAWGGWIVVFGIIPVLDWLIGGDSANAPESAVAALDADRYYRWIVYAFIPTQFALTIWGAWIVAALHPASWIAIGLILTVGTVNGIGINTAHELGHKTNGLERWLAKLALAPVAYGHFFVEHNRGHHARVATPEDPASSKMGETFWAFLPRTVIGSLRSGWHIEKERLARNRHRTWSIHNEILQAFAMTAVLYGALTITLGWIVLPFLLLQAAYGASLLEVVNYMEHYGLLRRRLPGGRVERCRPEHSWNSNNVVTNVFLYQLQRHSDHHANPTRRFQALRPFENSPQLPAGYAGLLWFAYIPPLWFRSMDKRVAAHYRGDLTRANLYAPRREALMARWHTTISASEPASEVAEAADVVEAPAPAISRYTCPNCGHIYDEALGDAHHGYPAGTSWAQIPADWTCPDCAVREKPDFLPLSGQRRNPCSG